MRGFGRTTAATSRRWACRLPLFVMLGVLALAGSARAASYYEPNAPYRFGTGGAEFGMDVDAATGAFKMGDDLASIPGRVPISLKWGFNSHDNSDGPLGKGTSLSTDWFVAASTVLGAGYYELQAPGNRRYALSQSGGVYINTTDPEVLGATLTFASPPNGLASTLRWKDGGKLFFNATGELYRIEDRLGNYLTISRNASGYPTAITQPSGRTVTLAYGTNGKLASVTLPLSRTWQLAYDGSNRLNRVTDLNGFHEDYTWSTYTRSDGAVLPLVVTVKDKRGYVQVTNAYDTSGRISTQTFNDGGVLQATYSAALGSNGSTTVTDPRNNVRHTDYTWTPSRFGYLITSTTNALNRTTTYTRGGATYLVTAVTDFRNRSTSYGWDITNKGNLISLTKPTASGGTVTWNYGYEQTFSQRTSATDPLNRQTVWTVDPTTGNVTSVTDPANATTSFSYASNGDVLSVTNALNQASTMTYSADGDLLTVTDPLSHQTSAAYDGGSRKTSTTDANGKTTWLYYDAMDNLGVITRFLNGAPVYTQFVYDEDGRRRFLIDGNNHFWETRYDTKGRVSLEINPLLAAKAYTWDLNDNLSVYQDRKSQQAVYLYGTGDRLTSATFKRADGSTESSYTLNYNTGTDLVDSINDSVSGSFSFQYDGLDRKISESCQAGSCVYGYDDLGRRSWFLPSGQSIVLYNYNERDQLFGVAQDGILWGAYFYDALGRLRDIVRPWGPNHHREYNADGTLSILNNGAGDQHYYTYDPAHNMVSQLIGLIQWTYSYDDLYRLKTAENVNHLYTWTYDAVGNRLQQVDDRRTIIVTDNSGYDAANRLVNFNGNPLTYDANGSLIGYGNDTYTWDVRNRLVGLNRTGGTPLTASFAYDFRDNRVSKTINLITTYLLNDGGSVVGESGGSSAATLQGAFIDQPLARGGLVMAQDQLGSTTGLYDSTGTLVGSGYQYQPFGEVAGSSGSNPFQFTGRDNDGTGLYYYRARYYAPQWGRFISEDPIGFAGGENAYGYANNDPLNKTDPSGLSPKGYVGADGKRLHDKYEYEHRSIGQRIRDGLGSVLDWFKIILGVNAVITPEDLGIRGKIEELRGTIELKGDTLQVRIDMIKGEIENPLEVINNLMELARSRGATALRIEGTLANERLLALLQRRYGMQTSGATDVILILLK